MRPLAVRSERKSEENGERWKKEKKISTAAAGHRVEEIFLCWRSSVRHGEDEAERCAVSTFSEEEKTILSLQRWERMRMATMKG